MLRRRIQIGMKQVEKKYIGFKDVVLTIGLTLIVAIIQIVAAMPFAAAPFLLAYVSAPTSMLVSGALFVLIMNKAPYRGTMFLFVAVLCAPMLFLGAAYVLPVSIFILGGAMGELVFWKNMTRTYSKLTIAFAIYAATYGIGTYGVAVLTRDSMLTQLSEQGTPQEVIDQYMTLYTLPYIAGAVVLGVVCAVLGIYFGTKIFKKHFARITA